MSRQVVIVGAARTPVGTFLGSLSSLAAPRLGAVAIREALERARVKPQEVQQVYMGNVLQAGVGQAPARQASIFAGIPETVPCTTVNKVCGSGLKAVIHAAQDILLGDAEVVVAGGMESMSNAPYLLAKARNGYRMGHGEIQDAMIVDGLWDVYGQVHMGECAEQCAESMSISRGAQDEYAVESVRRARAAQAEGAFKAEIVPVPIPGKKGETTLVADDEGPQKAMPEKVPGLKPAFRKDKGTVTAGNSSSINDGAAALVLMSEARAAKEGRPILGRIVGYGGAAKKPAEFTIAPTDAIKNTLARLELKTQDIDLYEINEAFAVVSIANNQLLGLDPAAVNVRGGAVALGHPIGASGARILCTLLYAMKDLKKRRGLASLCIGGGEGIAMVVERL